MNSIIKKLFSTLLEKPWEEGQSRVDSAHSGKAFSLSNQMAAVFIIFGVSTAIFSLIFTGYLVSLTPQQDTTFVLKQNLLWINTFVLVCVTFYFNKISSDFGKNNFSNINKTERNIFR